VFTKKRTWLPPFGRIEMHTTFTKRRQGTISDEKMIHLNEGAIKSELKDLVRSSVEETLNGLLEQEAQFLINAAKYERSKDRQGYRSGHYERNLLTSSGEVKLKVPKLKGSHLRRRSSNDTGGGKARWRKR
jgi:hypothetical protein